MSNSELKPEQGIEDISEAIKRTLKKYNDLELDKDLSVIISVETEPNRFSSNKKDLDNNNKSSFEKDSFSLKNLKFENNINNSNLEQSNEISNSTEEKINKKINSTATEYYQINKFKNLNLNANDMNSFGIANEFEIKDPKKKEVFPLNIHKDNLVIQNSNNLSLELNESTQNLIRQNNLNFNNIDFNLIYNKMNNNEKHIRNNSENVYENKSKLNKINNTKNPYSLNNNNNQSDKLLANSNFNTTVDRIYSSLEDFQKNIEKDFTEIEEIIDNLIEKDLKLLK